MKTGKYVEELKVRNVAELREALVSTKKELFDLKFQNTTSQPDNTARVSEVHRNIARTQTVITEQARA